MATVSAENNIFTMTSTSFIEVGQWIETALKFAQTTTPHIPLVTPCLYGEVEADLILMKVNPHTGFVSMSISKRNAVATPLFLGWIDYTGPGAIHKKIDSWADEKLYERAAGVASPVCKSTGHRPSRETAWRDDISTVGPIARRHEFALQLYGKCFFCYVDDRSVMSDFASLIPDPEPSAW